jgi:hypothetical protein
MMKKLSAFALLAGIVVALPAAADNSLARFKGGIGVHPVSSGVDPTVPPDPNKNSNVNRNIVRGVQPPGQIWVIKDLDARVRASGHITVRGKGLILGGGNNVGRATGQIVFATLICEALAPFVQHSTTLTGVPLAANGDFRIDDMLTPAPPFTCASPMLLIRSAGLGQPWFAAGIPALDNDDD